MVDSISNNGPISTLLRAQAAGAPSIAASAQQQQPAQAIINQQANGAKPTTVQPAFKSAGASKGESNLPRGSIVDILA